MVLVHVHRFHQPTNKSTHVQSTPNEITHSTRNLPKRHQPPTHNPPKRNRRGGACVPARTSAQRRFHTKNTRIVRGELNDGCALDRATRAGTQAPPLPNSIIFFHAIPHKQNNHLHAIHPSETVGAVPVCPPERPRSGVSIPKTHALCAGMNDGCALECRRVIIICIEVPIKSARRGRLGYCLNYSFVHLAGELQWYNYNHYHHYHSYKTQ